MASLEELLELVAEFNRARSWRDAHTPGALAQALSIETAELQRHFLWKDVAAQYELMSGPSRDEVEAEIADIMIYILTFCDRYSIDLDAAVRRKVAVNEQRFPRP